MDDPTPEEAEELAPPRDLRAQLFQDLSTRFTAALESDGSLPAAAQKALVELIDSEAPTAAQIIGAASKSDPEEEEAPSE
jgi:hypothetical protein